MSGTNRANFAGSLLFLLFLCFCLGSFLGRSFPYFLIFSLAFLFFFIASYISYRKNRLFVSNIFILTLFISLGALWQIPSSSGKIDKFLNQKQDFVLKVISLPQEHKRQNIFKAEIKKVNSTSFKFRVKARDYTKSLEYLTLYQVRAKLTKRKYHGRWFYYLWIKSKVKPKGLPLGILAKSARKTSFYILDVFKTNCRSQAYAFLSAVFLGRRELLDEEKDFFMQAGLSHLLAISGLHMGLTSLILFFILRFFNINFRVCLVASLIFLLFYTFLTGASSSTLRAVIMYSAFVVSFFLKRKTHPLNSLALAGFVILAWEPRAIFSVGFQLSFTSVLAIILGFRIFPLKASSNSLLNSLKQIFFCSLFVSLSISPLVSYYFGKVYILSLVHNMFLIPYFSFILTVNFLLLIFSPFPFIAQSLGEVLSWLISFFITLVKILGSLKFSFISYTFSLKGVFAYYLSLIFAGSILRPLLKFDKNTLL